MLNTLVSLIKFAHSCDRSGFYKSADDIETAVKALTAYAQTGKELEERIKGLKISIDNMTDELEDARRLISRPKKAKETDLAEASRRIELYPKIIEVLIAQLKKCVDTKNNRVKNNVPEDHSDSEWGVSRPRLKGHTVPISQWGAEIDKWEAAGIPKADPEADTKIKTTPLK